MKTKISKLIILFFLLLSLPLILSCDDGKENNKNEKSEDSSDDEYTEKKLPPEVKDEEQICLSLKVLNKKVQSAVDSNLPIEDVCLNLAGLNYIEGYIIDDNYPGKDIILLGRKSKLRPPLKLDDLILLMSISSMSNDYPYCSLEPSPERIKSLINYRFDASKSEKEVIRELEYLIGPQQTVIGGVPFNSRIANVMIDADYHMKKVSQEHIKLEHIKSTLQLKAESKSRLQSSMSRFWFHIKKGCPNFIESDGIVCINSCDVVLLTENQIADTKGNLYDSDSDNEDDSTSIIFSKLMSQYFENLTFKVKEYGDLDNIYRLYSIVNALIFKDEFTSVGFNNMNFIPGYEYQNEKILPREFKGLANCIKISNRYSQNNTIRTEYLVFIVCGGVSMDLTIGKNKFYDNKKYELDDYKKAILETRPDETSLFWVYK